MSRPAPWAIAWSAAFAQPVHGVWAHDQRVVVSLADGGLIGVERTTGARVWERPAFKRATAPVVEQYSDRNPRPRSVMLRPVVVAGNIVVASGRDVSAYAVGDGTLVWRCNLVAADGVLADDRHLLAWSDEQGRAVGLDPADGRLRWSTELPTLSNSNFQGASQSLSGDQAVLLGEHAAVLDLRSGAIRWSFSDAEVIGVKVSLSAAPAVVVPQNPRQLRRRRMHQAAVYQPSDEDFSGTSWITSFINRARQPWASVVACGDDLLIGDWSSSGVISLALPLRCTAIPMGTVLGYYGRSVLLVTSTTAEVCSLDDGQPIASIPLDALQRKQDEGLTPQSANAWVSGAVSGRLAWISGPGGVVTIDLDQCEIVDQQPWQHDWSVADDDVTNWALGGAMVQQKQQNNNGDYLERLPVGVVSAGFVVLPVGSQRLVALSGPAPRTDAAADGKPAGANDGR